MLRNTLIVPETDARAAAKMIKNAIDALDVVLMILLGKGSVTDELKMDDVVNIADQLCKKTQVGAYNARHVIWVRDTTPQSIQEVLAPLLEGVNGTPIGIVLNFHNQRKSVITKDKLEPFEMEMAFAAGHAS